MNRLEIDLKKLRENEIDTAMATIPPPKTFADYGQTWRVYEGGVIILKQLEDKIKELTPEEQDIVLAYVQKLMESRPGTKKCDCWICLEAREHKI